MRDDEDDVEGHSATFMNNVAYFPHAEPGHSMAIVAKLLQILPWSALKPGPSEIELRRQVLILRADNRRTTARARRVERLQRAYIEAARHLDRE
jgi:hypothetical protein